MAFVKSAYADLNDIFFKIRKDDFHVQKSVMPEVALD
jgi:hypothetical protein